MAFLKLQIPTNGTINNEIISNLSLTYLPLPQCDLEDAREVSKEKGQELANKLKCKFLETSAKDRVNVAECFYELVREIHKYRINNAPKEHTEVKSGPSRRKACAIL